MKNGTFKYRTLQEILTNDSWPEYNKKYEKYKYLKSFIEIEKLRDVTVIHIENDNDLKNKLRIRCFGNLPN